MFKAIRAVLILVLIATIGLMTTVLGQNRIDVCIVFDIGGRGDLSFNDMAALGGSNVADANGLNLVEVQSASEADYLPNLRTLSRSGTCVIILAIGFLLTDAVIEVAGEFPDESYAIVDGFIPDYDNVVSVLFTEETGSALVGALAALVNGIVAPEGSAGGAGIVLGIEIPVLWKFECGYKAGVRWVDNNFDNSVFDLTSSAVTLLSTPIPWVYTGSFSDPALGQSAAEAQLAQGTQVIYNVAGAVGLGMITAVADSGRALGQDTGPPFAIGVDASQDYLEGGGFVLASMMKRVDRGVEIAAQSAIDGSFQGGIQTLGLTEGGISVSNEDDFITFIQFGVDAGIIDPDDQGVLLSRHRTLRNRFRDEFSQVAELQRLIEGQNIIVPNAGDQESIDACRGAYDGGGISTEQRARIHEAAAAAAERAGNTDEARSERLSAGADYSLAGRQHSDAGRHERAGQAFEKAAEQYQEAGDDAQADVERRNAGVSFSAAGREHSDAGRHEQSGEAFEKAAELFEEAGNTAQSDIERRNAGISYSAAAQEHSDAGRHEQAAEAYERAAEQFEEAGNIAQAENARQNAANEREKANQ